MTAAEKLRKLADDIERGRVKIADVLCGAEARVIRFASVLPEGWRFEHYPSIGVLAIISPEHATDTDVEAAADLVKRAAEAANRKPAAG